MSNASNHMDGCECTLCREHRGECDHVWQWTREKYGEDADGNRGVWQEYEFCTKCHALKGEL